MVNALLRLVSFMTSLLRHPLICAVLAFCVIAGSQYHPFWMIVGIILAICVLIRLLIDVWRGRQKKYRYAKIFLLIASLVGYLAVPMELSYHWQESLALRIFPNKFDSCKARGVHFGVEGAQTLSVCDVNEKWWRDGRTIAIVYDSSGQIGWSENRRSREWKHAALSLYKVVPFGIVGFEAQGLADNLYVVDFDNDLTKNVITEE